ncbi:MAG: YkgJ family cysteine cluster protein [Vulcanimicrobiota bacterium]
MRYFLREILIALERFVRKLQGKPHEYFRLGRCRRCGSCCRDVALTVGGKKLTTWEEYESLTAEDDRYGIFVQKGVDTDGALLFSCKKLDSRNRCTMYSDRPQVCVDYPDPDLIKCGTDVIEGCGFYLVSPHDFRRILKEEMKRVEETEQ